MANEVKVGKNESIDSALRRFKRTCQKAGTLAEVRKASAVRRSRKLRVNANSERKSFICVLLFGRNFAPVLLRQEQIYFVKRNQ